MAKPPRQGVRYPTTVLEGGELVVERLRSCDVNLRAAAAVRSLMRQSYAAQFEQPAGPLPQDAISIYLFPDTKRGILRQHGRMSSHIATHSSQYWMVRNPESPWDFYGLAKVSARGVEADTPFGYFNDVAVLPDKQRNGLGLAMAHAALKFGPASQDLPLALDGYAGNTVNSWFEDEWGMVARGFDEAGVTVGGDHLSQVRYVTKGGLTVAGIVEAMEERHPQLAVGEFVEL